MEMDAEGGDMNITIADDLFGSMYLPIRRDSGEVDTYYF